MEYYFEPEIQVHENGLGNLFIKVKFLNVGMVKAYRINDIKHPFMDADFFAKNYTGECISELQKIHNLPREYIFPEEVEQCFNKIYKKLIPIFQDIRDGKLSDIIKNQRSECSFSSFIK